MVGELRLGDHLPPARRPVRPPERRRRRAVAARSRHRRRDVHAEPDHRRRRADDRGELGARRGGRRRPRDPRHLPHRPRRARCSSARPGLKKIAIRALPDGGTRRGGGGAGARRAALPRRRRSSRSSTRSPTAARRSTARRATSSGRSPAAQLYLLQCRAVTRGAAPDGRARPTATAIATSVPLFADLEPTRGRASRAVQGAPLRGGRDGHQGGLGRRGVLRDRVGRGDGHGRRPGARRRSAPGDYFGEIALIDEGARSATITADDRARLLRAHLLGVPPARAGERRDRLEAAAVHGRPAARRGGGRSLQLRRPAARAAGRTRRR